MPAQHTRTPGYVWTHPFSATLLACAWNRSEMRFTLLISLADFSFLLVFLFLGCGWAVNQAQIDTMEHPFTICLHRPAIDKKSILEHTQLTDGHKGRRTKAVGVDTASKDSMGCEALLPYGQGRRELSRIRSFLRARQTDRHMPTLGSRRGKPRLFPHHGGP